MASDKIFIDSDVILDLVLDRAPFAEFSEKIFSLPAKIGVQLFTSSLVIANAYYFARKQNGKKVANNIITELKFELTVLPVGIDAIDFALNGTFNGFEDGIQFYTAKHNQCSIILTRNLSDYKKASLPVMTAEQYLVTI